jgi:hypothetical protein
MNARTIEEFAAFRDWTRATEEQTYMGGRGLDAFDALLMSANPSLTVNSSSIFQLEDPTYDWELRL